MESSSSRRSKRQGHEKFLTKAILPAIRGQSCPICLKDFDGEDYRRLAVIGVCLHAYCLDCIRKWSDIKRKCPLCNLEFSYWFCRISLSSRNFSTEKLPVVKEGRRAKPLDILSSMQRAGLNVANRRSRPLPWRRRFGQPLPGSVSSDVIAQRKLQWRASIYNRRLHAVHISSRNCLKQIISRNCCMKQRILHRIEPWIQRELQAILEDPDPSVIVHLASSLFIASLERRSDVQSDPLVDEDHFLQPLQRFLHGWTNMFWHELRELSLLLEGEQAKLCGVKMMLKWRVEFDGDAMLRILPAVKVGAEFSRKGYRNDVLPSMMAHRIEWFPIGWKLKMNF